MDDNPQTPIRKSKSRAAEKRRSRPPPPMPLGLPRPKTPPPVAISTPPTPTHPPDATRGVQEANEAEKPVRWWHEWLCGCGEGPDRGGDYQVSPISSLQNFEHVQRFLIGWQNEPFRISYSTWYYIPFLITDIPHFVTEPSVGTLSFLSGYYTCCNDPVHWDLPLAHSWYMYRITLKSNWTLHLPSNTFHSRLFLSLSPPTFYFSM